MIKINLTNGIPKGILGLWKTDGEALYKYWLDNYGSEHIKKWLEDHSYNEDTCRSKEYVEYITNHFVDWVSSNE